MCYSLKLISNMAHMAQQDIYYELSYGAQYFNLNC